MRERDVGPNHTVYSALLHLLYVFFLLFRVLLVLEFLSVPLRALFPLPNSGCGLLAIVWILDFALGALLYQVCAKGVMLNKERISLLLN